MAYNLPTFTFDTVSNATIYVHQGTTYYNRWEIQYLGEAFPLFNVNDETTLDWCSSISITEPMLTIADHPDPYLFVEDIKDDLSELLSGTFLTQETWDDGTVHTFYGIYILAEDSINIPPGRLWYNIKVKRISDDWVIRLQEGLCMVTPNIGGTFL